MSVVGQGWIGWIKQSVAGTHIGGENLVQYFSPLEQRGGGAEGGVAQAGRPEIVYTWQFSCPPDPDVQTVGLACCPRVYQVGGPGTPRQLAETVEDPSKPA